MPLRHSEMQEMSLRCRKGHFVLKSSDQSVSEICLGRNIPMLNKSLLLQMGLNTFICTSGYCLMNLGHYLAIEPHLRHFQAEFSTSMSRRGPRNCWRQLLAGSLWHKGAYNRTFPCMEATYPLWHKRAGVSITLDQWEPSLDIPRPMRVENTEVGGGSDCSWCLPPTPTNRKLCTDWCTLIVVGCWLETTSCSRISSYVCWERPSFNLPRKKIL